LTDSIVKFYLGKQAALLKTPGHSADSIAIVLGRSIALVGDAMVNVEGMLYPPFADEPEAVLTSWKTLLETNCEVFCPAHGAPLKRERLLAAYTEYCSLK
jgi:glyoxylase-like metal-dependent hydrolase (beta-lactamase superfamily II)